MYVFIYVYRTSNMKIHMNKCTQCALRRRRISQLLRNAFRNAPCRRHEPPSDVASYTQCSSSFFFFS